MASLVGGTIPPIIVDMPREVFTTSQPYVFRDTTTLLQKIQQFQNYLNELSENINELSENTDNLQDNLINQLEELAKQLNDRLFDMYNQLIAMIKDTQISGVAFSPVRGNYDSVSSVLGDMYDNLRYYGIFATDYDEMQLTAAEYDTCGITARQYDLSASTRLNPLNGTYKGRSDFCVSLNPPQTTEPVNPYPTRQEIENNFMKLNPQAQSFEGK